MGNGDDFTAVHEVTYEIVKSGTKLKTGTLKDFVVDHSSEFQGRKLIFTENKNPKFLFKTKKEYPDNPLIIGVVFGDKDILFLEKIESVDFIILFRNYREMENGVDMLKPVVL